MSTAALARLLWPRVTPLLPKVRRSARRRGGRPRIDDEVVFRQLVVFLLSGTAWHVFDDALSGSPVSGSTLRRRLSRWRAAGVFERVEAQLRAALPAARISYLDASFIRQGRRARSQASATVREPLAVPPPLARAVGPDDRRLVAVTVQLARAVAPLPASVKAHPTGVGIGGTLVTAAIEMHITGAVRRVGSLVRPVRGPPAPLGVTPRPRSRSPELPRG